MTTNDQWRPVYHFTPPANFINDPNGLVCFRGEYHLFYQHNPFGNTWGHMSWGHAVSRDLARWEHLPVALWEEEGVMIFSGSAVVDWRNTSGLGRGTEPPLIAVYTGHTATEQAQCIAYSLDAGRTWTKYAGNPVLAIGSPAFRDPKVFWHVATQRWIMLVGLADEHRVRFYASPDLIHWQHLSDFGPAGSADGVWECPDLFPLAVEGGRGEMRWVLKVDVGAHAGPGREGAQYFVGHFDGERFLNDNPPETTLWVDGGADFYAAQSWSDIPAPDGRRLWLAWMNNWHYANVTPTISWRGAMTAPRAVSLRRTPAGLRLAQRPAAELAALRGAHFGCAEVTIGEANRLLRAASVMGDALEISADLRLADGDQAGLRVRVGKDEATAVGCDAAAQELFVDRTRSGVVDFSPYFPARHAVSLPAAEGQVRLHVLVDRCSVEVFGGAGDAVLTDLIFPSPADIGLEVFGTGRAAFVERLHVWQLRTP